MLALMHKVHSLGYRVSVEMGSAHYKKKYTPQKKRRSLKVAGIVPLCAADSQLYEHKVIMFGILD